MAGPRVAPSLAVAEDSRQPASSVTAIVAAMTVVVDYVGLTALR